MRADAWSHPPESRFPGGGRGSRHEDRSQEGNMCIKGGQFFQWAPSNMTFSRKTLGSRIYFRRQGKAMSVSIFISEGDAGNPRAIDAVQYAPIMDTVLLWDMLPCTRVLPRSKKGEWNHIKLVISGANAGVCQ